MLEECLFERESVIHLELKKKYREYDEDEGWNKNIGGGGPGAVVYRSLKAVDLEAGHLEGRGIPVQNGWEGYSYGLNIYGTCPNKYCPSHKIKCEQTTFRAKYGSLRIDLKNKLFPCPACGSEFPPGNFAVCNARALFRFRKTEGHFEVQSTVLESSGGIDEYAMFNSEAPDGEYDWIEVKTVKHYKSVYVCVKCDMPIGERTDGVLYECSHPVHRKCLEEDCCLCKAKVLTDKQIRGLATNGKLMGPGSSGGRSRGIRGRGRGTRGRRKK
ncbi:unnamed protein product [Orchesella dallaii]|uniref:RING-type domain-containing protein n=1 Tax=Orchesella dallaii TaxID=48710 RepID=A0ABP1RY05_9HEXA